MTHSLCKSDSQSVTRVRCWTIESRAESDTLDCSWVLWSLFSIAPLVGLENGDFNKQRIHGVLSVLYRFLLLMDGIFWRF